ncbi:MAG: TRAP transporter substrate-binding protein [Candidatus Sifarchaeia archaeon]
MLNKNLTLIICTLIIGLAFSVFVSPPVAAQKPVTLKIAHLVSPKSGEQLACLYFKKLVEENSKGRIKIATYPAGQLGEMAVQVEGLISGSLEMGLHGLSHYGRTYKDLEALSTPFTFRSREQKKELINSQLFGEMIDGLLALNGVRILAANLERGPYKVVLSREPLFSIEDFKGKKFRIPELHTYMAAWKAIGVIPIVTAWAEVYLALKQNVVDAMELPFSHVYTNKLHEAGRYILVTEHLYQNSAIVMNNKRFMAFPKDLRMVLVDAAKKAGEYFTNIEAKHYKEYKAKILKAGGVMIEIDRGPFFKVVEPAFIQLETDSKWSKGLAKKILEYTR